MALYLTNLTVSDKLKHVICWSNLVNRRRRRRRSQNMYLF